MIIVVIFTQLNTDDLTIKSIMNLDEAIKVFERYFGGELTESPKLFSGSRSGVIMSIGDTCIKVYSNSINWGDLNVKSIHVVSLTELATVEDYVINAATELSDILNGDPSKRNIRELATNHILEILDKGKTLRGMPVIKDTQYLVEVHKLNPLDNDTDDVVKELKSTYGTNLFHDDTHCSNLRNFSYLFSIKVDVIN